MLNIIIYFPGPDCFSDRNLLGETGSPVGTPVLSSVKAGVSPLGLGLWAGRALGGAGREGLSRSSLPPTQGASWKPLQLWDPLF